MSETVSPVRCTYRVTGMDCAHCVEKITDAVSSIDGVRDVETSLMKEEMTLVVPDKEEVRKRVEETVKSLGYGIAPKAGSSLFGASAEPEVPLRERVARYATVVATVLWLTGFGFSLAKQPEIARALYVAAIVLGGYEIMWSGLQSLRRFRFDLDVLMTVAVIGAAAINEWGEAAAVVVLFSISEMLESYSVDRARNAIRALMDLVPRVVTVRRDGELVEMPVEEAQVGETAIVRPGERIPLDGVITSGRTQVNQAPITGESKLVEKEVGDTVFAGTINDTGAFEFTITQHAEDTTLARIIHLVQEAQSEQAPSQRFIDRFASYYTPAIIGIAIAMTAIPVLVFGADFQTWFYRSLVVLVTGCPCALVISTPVSIMSGLTRAARIGLLIKGGVYLENFGKVDAVVFDKTGTLTEGSPQVEEVIVFGEMTPHDLLLRAANVETHSEHALAKAIVAAAEEHELPVDSTEKEFVAYPGKGAGVLLDGTMTFVGNPRLFEELGVSLDAHRSEIERLEKAGKTVVLVGTDTEVFGAIGIGDRLRPQSAETVRALKATGVRHTVMLTGDNEIVAQEIADATGVDEVQAGLLPQEKVEHVKRLRDQYQMVAMVGDGINDAPALAAANIGIAMGGTGTDVALEAADISLMGDDLAKLPVGLRLSRVTMRTLRGNVAFAVATKGIILVLAGFGIAPLWLAVLADTGVSLIVVLNSLRLLRWRTGTEELSWTN